MHLKFSWLVPMLLLVAAAFFYIKDARKFQTSEPSVAPETNRSDNIFPKPLISEDQEIDQDCLQRSTAIYDKEIATYESIERQVGYGRLRDDGYGKGLNTITKEKLVREGQCS